MRIFFSLLLIGCIGWCVWPVAAYADVVAPPPAGGGQTGQPNPQGGGQTGQPTPTYACRFTCSPRATPTVPGRIGNVRVSCSGPNDTTTCTQACQARCPVSGASGNGIEAAQGGTELVCSQSPQPTCVAVTPPTGGGNTGGSAPVDQAAASSTYDLPNPIGTTDVPTLFGRVIRAFLGILGGLALFWFVWGGILWMTAEESKRTEQAQSIMRNATLGLVIIFFSYGLTTLFLSLFQEVAAPAASQQGRTLSGESPITSAR